jgi:hypothetical protein
MRTDSTVMLDQIYLDEETYWQQRARLKWLLEGDMNTIFFHMVANNRRRKNLILSLQINDTININITDITLHILGYLKNLLGNEEKILVSLDKYI